MLSVDKFTYTDFGLFLPNHLLFLPFLMTKTVFYRHISVQITGKTAFPQRINRAEGSRKDVIFAYKCYKIIA